MTGSGPTTWHTRLLIVVARRLSPSLHQLVVLPRQNPLASRLASLHCSPLPRHPQQPLQRARPGSTKSLINQRARKCRNVSGTRWIFHLLPRDEFPICKTFGAFNTNLIRIPEREIVSLRASNNHYNWMLMFCICEAQWWKGFNSFQSPAEYRN